MCETYPKKEIIPAWLREYIMSSTWNSAQQTILPHFQAMFHIHISGHKYLCAKYTFCFILIGEKRLGKSEDNRNPPPLKGEQRTPQSEDVEEGEVEEVIEIVTTTGDVQVVEEQSTYFTSDSAQRLIQDIMWCSRDLDLINEKTKEIEHRLKNVIDVLGRI
ncbi:hypothetical protein AB205_0078850 [Aquarana catesbeiana]|uniref:Uncharacterized protein n=1 Tax=Aquarana catesbeiana TaxID=8400 RepID=A0A2G9RAY7_AQUCT|nr:hypothetical protein AB205_0078850 [Aquarana catesbeiana]